jgi:hypothetical protein
MSEAIVWLRSAYFITLEVLLLDPLTTIVRNSELILFFWGVASKLTMGKWEYTIARVFGIGNHSPKRVERSWTSSSVNMACQAKST